MLAFCLEYFTFALTLGASFDPDNLAPKDVLSTLYLASTTTGRTRFYITAWFGACSCAVITALISRYF
jgi:hypothetical protein